MAQNSQNPLRMGMERERIPDPFAMVVFGASGDLTERKLVPALFELSRGRFLPPGFTLVGMARRPLSDEEFRARLRSGVDEFGRSGPSSDLDWENFSQSVFYQAGDFQDPQAYAQLKDRLEALEGSRDSGGNRIFYLATQPDFFPLIVEQLGKSGLAAPRRKTPPTWTKIIVEKPFGHDLESARELNGRLLQVFQEPQIYRIDHYLGKETVQNILVIRFANGIFEPLWNSKYLDQVQITVAESIGIEGRGPYFEKAGIWRDMVQNHVMQLVSLVAMEPPVSFDADEIRDEKVKVLRSLHCPTGSADLANMVRGQYGPGWAGGQPVPGYRQEERVDPASNVETYAALRLAIDNWRWAGVPFFIRCAKRMPKRVTEISVHFKRPPYELFARYGSGTLQSNVLVLRIQPDEGMALGFSSKVPGPAVVIRPVKMDFAYGASFGTVPPEAYERLLLDCALGDSTLFTRSDEVEAAWTFVSAYLQLLKEAPVPSFPNYEAGSWGPPEADRLIEQTGHSWRSL